MKYAALALFIIELLCANHFVSTGQAGWAAIAGFFAGMLALILWDLAVLRRGEA